MKLTLSFQSSCFATWPKSQDKNLNTLRTKRALEVKQKTFFIVFKGLSVAKNFLRPESAPLRLDLCSILFNMIFLVNLVKITSYVSDNSLCSVGKKQCKVENKLEWPSEKLFKWFRENAMKSHQGKCHFFSFALSMQN